MDSFAARVAVVTGGASGIGRAISAYLGRHGSTVTVADRDLAGAERVAAAIVSKGGCAEAVRVEVSDEQSVRRLIDEVCAKHGRIDVLFNNAGVSVNGEFQDTGDEHWRRVFDVNFWGVLYGCRAVYPIMMRQGSGHIINTASLAGLIPGGLTSAYSASKHAVVGLSLTLRSEARVYGIKVSTLCPGYIRTGIQNTTPTVTPYMDSERNRAANAKMKFLTAEECVDRFMAGVRRNRGIIFAPNRQRIYWWMHRLFPEFIPNMFTRIIVHLKHNA